MYAEPWLASQAGDQLSDAFRRDASMRVQVFVVLSELRMTAMITLEQCSTFCTTFLQ